MRGLSAALFPNVQYVNKNQGATFFARQAPTLMVIVS